MLSLSLSSFLEICAHFWKFVLISGNFLLISGIFRFVTGNFCSFVEVLCLFLAEKWRWRRAWVSLEEESVFSFRIIAVIWSSFVLILSLLLLWRDTIVAVIIYVMKKFSNKTTISLLQALPQEFLVHFHFSRKFISLIILWLNWLICDWVHWNEIKLINFLIEFVTD